MQTWIGSKEIIELLLNHGFTDIEKTGNHFIVKNDRTGYRLIFPDHENIPIGTLTSIRHALISRGFIGEEEVAKFLSEKSPLVGMLFHHKEIHKEITDKVLIERLRRLGSTPQDTFIREAGVILEDRLRKISGITDNSLYGVTLVDALMTPGKAKIIFSTNLGEQDGARMLYRGAIQFIRNPAMHKLIDYSTNEFIQFIRVIDSLLNLLSEAKVD